MGHCTAPSLSLSPCHPLAGLTYQRSLAQRTMSGKGTPQYIAPELRFYGQTTTQLQEPMKPSALVDIWSTGIVVYTMVFRTWPFNTATRAKFIRALQQPPKRLRGSELCDDVTWRFITDLLSVDPNKRPTAAQALQHEFLQGVDVAPQL